MDTRLTREFDLSGLTSATLRYRAWFETERGWDYAYVAASTDGGKTWRALPATHTSDYDPVGAAYGPGYTGDSGGKWVQESVDLTAFAGRKVLLRFEYVTDDAAHARGFAVDDISIPELGFSDGADSDGGWQAEGFPASKSRCRSGSSCSSSSAGTAAPCAAWSWTREPDRGRAGRPGHDRRRGRDRRHHAARRIPLDADGPLTSRCRAKAPRVSWACDDHIRNRRRGRPAGSEPHGRRGGA